MILQCDQCHTKFRLDDSKMKPGGVKVRCSKCRHVFVAGAEPEPKQEDTDFEALLAGLGAPAAEKAGEPASGGEFDFAEPPATAAASAAPTATAVPTAEPVAPEPGAPAAPAPGSEMADFGDFDFGDEPAPPAGPAVGAAREPDFDAFEFSAEEPAAKEEERRPTPSLDDYGDFAFMDEPPPLKEEPAAPAAPAAEELEFGEFAFSAEPVKTEAPAAPAADLGFGEFDFDEAPAATPPAQEPAGPELDFGEFSFDEEPAAKVAAPAVPEDEFADFTMDEEPAIKPGTSAASEGDEFADFSFGETPAAPAPAPAAATDEFAFGDFNFSEEPAAKTVAPAAKEDFDFGDFTLGEEPSAKAAKTPAPEDGFDFSEFSFGEEPPPLEETPSDTPEDFSSFFAAHEEKTKESAPASEEGFSFGDLSAGAGKGAGAVEGFHLGGAEAEPAPLAPPQEPVPAKAAEEPKLGTTASSLDFSFGGKPFGAALPEGEEEEELPPLSISSRRKGRSLVKTALAAVAVVLVVAITGAALYLLQSGPSAAQTFDKVGLGFVAKWFGIEAPDEGRITIAKPLASFYQNKEAGELFVVTGQAVNSFKKARASIHVRVSIFDKKGAVIMQKTAYCGNKLSKEQLETLPMAKIDAIMNNQFGDSLSNLGVKPGQSIGFVVAMANVPKEAADFGVEVVGSTVAGQ